MEDKLIKKFKYSSETENTGTEKAKKKKKKKKSKKVKGISVFDYMSMPTDPQKTLIFLCEMKCIIEKAIAEAEKQLPVCEEKPVYSLV